MRIMRRLRWWGLFALIPLAITLMVLDDEAPFSETLRLGLLAAIAVAICVLAVAWTEKNARLMEREGVDALINYRPLPGTIEAMGGDISAENTSKVVARRLIVDYDPAFCPPVANNREDGVPEEMKW